MDTLVDELPNRLSTSQAFARGLNQAVVLLLDQSSSAALWAVRNPYKSHSLVWSGGLACNQWPKSNVLAAFHAFKDELARTRSRAGGLAYIEFRHCQQTVSFVTEDCYLSS